MQASKPIALDAARGSLKLSLGTRAHRSRQQQQHRARRLLAAIPGAAAAVRWGRSLWLALSPPGVLLDADRLTEVRSRGEDDWESLGLEASADLVTVGCRC